MKTTHAALLVIAAVLSGGCAGSARPERAQTSQAPARSVTPPLFEGLGRHHRAISTGSTQAQRYFDQGLTLAYAFNHDEAIRSFTEAARLDPQCAMAWWGIALCNGPHINNPAMDEQRSAAAWAAVEKARSIHAGTDVERRLIQAVAARYSPDPQAPRAPLDQAYAAAMRDLWRDFPNDADIGCLFAESMMDLRPWDLWTLDGRAQEGTPEILATLERVLQLDPMHPGANHLYIHAVEASPHPERAVAAADRLRTLAPGAGHLVHMPAHIDVRTGKWAAAAEANRRAIKADQAYRRVSPRQGFYHVYMAHNHHFLAYACMMEGRRDEALAAARAMVAGIPEEFLSENGALVDPYTPIVVETMVRFGMWDRILREPAPPESLPITRAFWRFSRAVALAAKSQVSQAREEQALFREQVASLPGDAMMAINKASVALSIADDMLEGEIAYREGRIDDAVASLRRAVATEDGLKYMEPPDWIQPVRHPLGAILLDAGRAAEAEQVYRDDLARWPENGWSLYGLSRALRAQGKLTEADAVEQRFARAWARADVKINASCLCVRPKS